jgi:hypothetical protein
VDPASVIVGAYNSVAAPHADASDVTKMAAPVRQTGPPIISNLMTAPRAFRC